MSGLLDVNLNAPRDDDRVARLKIEMSEIFMNHSPLLNSLIDIALAEDYAMGDITADALIPRPLPGPYL